MTKQPIKDVLDAAAAAPGKLAKGTVDTLLKRVTTERIKAAASQRGILDEHVKTLSPALLTAHLRQRAAYPMECFSDDEIKYAFLQRFGADYNGISDAELMDVAMARIDLGKYVFDNIAGTHAQRAKRWHTNSDGEHDEWSIADWFVAMMGELGEAANVAKKLRRLKGKLKGNKAGEDVAALEAKLGKEVADTFHYGFLLTNAANINLWDAFRETFNAKSAEFDFPERL